CHRTRLFPAARAVCAAPPRTHTFPPTRFRRPARSLSRLPARVSHAPIPSSAAAGTVRAVWRCVAPASLRFSPSPTTSPRILLRPTDTQRLACTFLLYSPFPSPPMHLTRSTETMAPYDLPRSPSTICASRISSNIPFLKPSETYSTKSVLHFCLSHS
ncbi:hypothetical protein C8J57DRAFT_1613147, partial [Mycena rebaudengoi]